MNYRFSLVALTSALVVTIGSAYAAKPVDNDALAIDNTKITLTQAIAAAEQHTGGKAARGELEKAKGQWVYDIEVVKGKLVTDVKVDPATGNVLSAQADKIDHDDRHDKQD